MRIAEKMVEARHRRRVAVQNLINKIMGVRFETELPDTLTPEQAKEVDLDDPQLLCLHWLKKSFDECYECRGYAGGITCSNYTNQRHIEDFRRYNIEDVYKTTVWVKQNPVSLRPHVFLIAKDNINKHGVASPYRQGK